MSRTYVHDGSAVTQTSKQMTLLESSDKDNGHDKMSDGDGGRLTPLQVKQFLALNAKERSNHVWKAQILRWHYHELHPDILSSLCPFCDRDTLNEGIIVRSANNRFLALYNIRPVFVGHLLVLPTGHISRFTDIPMDDAAEFLQFQQDVILALKRVYGTESFNTLLQEGEYSGQSIQHLHLHVIPRTKGDLPDDVDWLDYFQKHEHKGRILSAVERQAEAVKIREAYEAIHRERASASAEVPGTT